MRRTSIEVDGLRTPVLETGEAGASEALVCVHGNPGSVDDFPGLLGATGPLLRSVAIGMPGYGEADRPADWPYDVPAYAHHLQLALEALGITRAHLVLHDFGGPWGMQWAIDHPESVASFTVINSPAVMDQWHLLAKVWRIPLVGELVMATTSRPVFRGLMRFTDPRLGRAHVDRMYEDFTPATRRGVLKLYRATDVAPYVERAVSGLLGVQRPTLVVWGTRDKFLPAHLAFRQREAFPGATVVQVEGAGHWPMLEAPDIVEGAVAQHLRAVLGDGA